MARFTKDIVLNKPDDFVKFIMDDFLRKNDFKMSEWKGASAYRTGDAMIEGYRFLTWSYENGRFHLEAWMKGAFGREQGLDGFAGALIKRSYKSSLEQLFTVLQQPIPDASVQAGMQGAGVNTIPVVTVDNHGAAVMGMVLGIVSIVLCIIPLLGLICGTIGWNRSKLGGGSSKAAMASAGKICSMIGIIFSIAMWVFNIFLSF